MKKIALVGGLALLVAACSATDDEMIGAEYEAGPVATVVEPVAPEFVQPAIVQPAIAQPSIVQPTLIAAHGAQPAIVQPTLHAPQQPTTCSAPVYANTGFTCASSYSSHAPSFQHTASSMVSTNSVSTCATPVYTKGGFACM